jgi:hypothetical protein
MTKLERIQEKYDNISIIFATEYEQVSAIIHQGDFSKNLDIAIMRRRATTKALRCLLKMIQIEKERTANFSISTSN